jgi:lysophospholipase
LIVYLPNHDVTYSSNYSLKQENFTDAQRDAVIMNGYNVATQANGTLDDQWSTCVGCAVLSRSLDRTGTTVPEACVKCFQRYCWNGTLDGQTKTTSSSTSASSSIKESLSAALYSAVLMVGMAVLVTA